ncbi:MAG: hypothetical protein A3I02_16965 [Betaproteobacteria bacterium RIFCSPLOWO2_02_FULL_67_26]|nr:MAG: hypothetical protein A3I02_16965 [Betaproteobacteria bacterium RIFCSPLOWO2_02_FULL_67_26]
MRYDTASRRILLMVRVQPNARRSEITGLHGAALKIKVAAPAVDNKANTVLVQFLGEALGIPKSAIIIRRGASSRSKLLEITGGPELAANLQALAVGRPTTHDPRSTPST